MTDHLELARQALRRAEQATLYSAMVAYGAVATANAAIAQAEQLQRIADALSAVSGEDGETYTVAEYLNYIHQRIDR